MKVHPLFRSNKTARRRPSLRLSALILREKLESQLMQALGSDRRLPLTSCCLRSETLELDLLTARVCLAISSAFAHSSLKRLNEFSDFVAAPQRLLRVSQ